MNQQKYHKNYQLSQREPQKRTYLRDMPVDGGRAGNTHEQAISKRAGALIAATAAVMLFFSSVAHSQERDRDDRVAGDGPRAAAQGARPGCQIIPPLPSTRTNIGILHLFPPRPPPDPPLAG